MTLVLFFPFLYSTHSACPIRILTLADSHTLSLHMSFFLLSHTHTCTQNVNSEKLLSSDITREGGGTGGAAEARRQQQGSSGPASWTESFPLGWVMEEDLVCVGEGGGGDRGLEERRVRRGWRQQRGQKKKMNSGELGSAGEAAEVSVGGQ